MHLSVIAITIYVLTLSIITLCYYLSLSIVLCCIHLSVLTSSSSSLSNYLSLYPLFYLVHIYLYLPPPPLLYRTISLSIYCSMLYTSICTYLLLLLSIELSLYLSIVLCCIHLSCANGEIVTGAITFATTYSAVCGFESTPMKPLSSTVM